ncbi:MAG TPA: LysE family translocator [Nitrolancea sp.]|nr:LysE family translocator [Nitrolancea sp.]
MELGLFVRGAILGFSIAAPVGPIGVLCIRRTLAEGRVVGLLSGLGAATADSFYGSIAAFGLTAVSSLLVGHQTVLRVVGGFFLCYLGIRTLLAAPAQAAKSVQRRHLLNNYLSTLGLTLTNPTTILSFVAIFAGLGWAGTSGKSYDSAALLVAGVFCGSAFWWLIISTGVSLVRSRFTPRVMGWVNRISGSVIFGFGVVALASLAW